MSTAWLQQLAQEKVRLAKQELEALDMQQKKATRPTKQFSAANYFGITKPVFYERRHYCRY